MKTALCFTLASLTLAAGCATTTRPAPADPQAFRAPSDWIGVSAAAETPAAPAGGDDLQAFNGKYVKITGADAHCPGTLAVEAKYADTHELAEVKMDDATVLAPNASPRREPAASGKPARFVEDRLSDGYAELEARNEAVSPDAARWKIRRVYSHKRNPKAPVTFSGFEVWEFVPKQGGQDLIRLHGTPSPEYSCEYKKS